MINNTPDFFWYLLYKIFDPLQIKCLNILNYVNNGYIDIHKSIFDNNNIMQNKYLSMGKMKT